MLSAPRRTQWPLAWELPGSWEKKRRRCFSRNTRNRRVVDEQRTRADARQTRISHLLATSRTVLFLFSCFRIFPESPPSRSLPALSTNRAYCKYHFTPTMQLQQYQEEPRGPTKSQILRTMPRPALPARTSHKRPLRTYSSNAVS